LYDEGEVFGGPEVVMTDGYDHVANHLAAGLDIRLDQRVERIEDGAEGVVVTANGQQLTASKVIVAVPLGVLKSASIDFSPTLPARKRDAIAGVGFSAVNKFLFVWDSTFWDDTDFLAFTSPRRDVFNWFLNVDRLSPNAHALMTFAFADEARSVEKATDAELTELVMSHLRSMYGPNIPGPKAMLRSAWVSDPNTLGSYSFTSVNTRMAHFDDLARTEGNLLFAGEHTHRDYFSTVHGAYLSGLRAAKEILG
jgi:monoamine oxidase